MPNSIISRIKKSVGRRFNRFKSLIQRYYTKNELHLIYFLARIQKSQGKVNLSDLENLNYGQHRSGWSYAIIPLKKLHNPQGVYVDTFIERSFVWSPKGVHAHKMPWTGFMHAPPQIPSWFQYEQSYESISQKPEWKESLPYCKGLYTLSSYHKQYLESKMNVRVENLLHPTEFPALQWTWEQFSRNRDKKVIQVGYWLRKLYSIYLLQAKGYRKIFLRKPDPQLDLILKSEFDHSEHKSLLTPETLSSAESVSFLSNRLYDHWLSENIVFMELYDASANNAVIECIARNTPLLINKIEAVVEYLGPEYPFYFNTLEEAGQMIGNTDLIKATHHYLVNHPYKEKFSREYFLRSFENSYIYQNII